MYLCLEVPLVRMHSICIFLVLENTEFMMLTGRMLYMVSGNVKRHESDNVVVKRYLFEIFGRCLASGEDVFVCSKFYRIFVSIWENVTMQTSSYMVGL